MKLVGSSMEPGCQAGLIVTSSVSRLSGFNQVYAPIFSAILALICGAADSLSLGRTS